MLDKELFKEQMERLNILYPNWRIDITDSRTMKVWYQEFKNYDDELFKIEVDRYINEQSYPPTVAGIKNSKSNDPLSGFK